MKILGIETSCDETAISIVEAQGDLMSPSFKILGSAINSQVKIHERYGGVFPTLAKREHQKNLPFVLREALEKAKLVPNSQFPFPSEFLIDQFLTETSKPKIDLIAVTIGPGLEPALWTGIEFAKKLGKKWSIPIMGINHMLGHITSVLLDITDENSKFQIPNYKQIASTRPKILNFPAIALLISGGHTELILLKSWREIGKLGETQDDAVGEAFDKVARMLGLPYPGGPEISRLAKEARQKNLKLETRFPRPMIHSKDLNFSFSGLKTAVLYYIKKIEKLGEKEKIEIAREFEDAVTETLISKTKEALNEHLPNTLIVGGGVIANNFLREKIMEMKKDYPQLEILIPEKTLATDNATMIAVASFIKYLTSDNREKPKLQADGNLEIN